LRTGREEYIGGREILFFEARRRSNSGDRVPDVREQILARTFDVKM
jgi:hypothetical protein